MNIHRKALRAIEKRHYENWRRRHFHWKLVKCHRTRVLRQAALAVAERLAAAKSMATAIVRRRAKIMIVRAAAAIPKTTMKSRNVVAGLKIGLGRFDIVCSLQWDKRCRFYFFCFARMSFHNGFEHLGICFATHTRVLVGFDVCVRWTIECGSGLFQRERETINALFFRNDLFSVPSECVHFSCSLFSRFAL